MMIGSMVFLAELRAAAGVFKRRSMSGTQASMHVQHALYIPTY